MLPQEGDPRRISKARQPFWGDHLYCRFSEGDSDSRLAKNSRRATLGQEVTVIRVCDKDITGGLQNVDN